MTMSTPTALHDGVRFRASLTVYLEQTAQIKAGFCKLQGYYSILDI